MALRAEQMSWVVLLDPLVISLMGPSFIGNPTDAFALAAAMAAAGFSLTGISDSYRKANYSSFHRKAQGKHCSSGLVFSQ